MNKINKLLVVALVAGIAYLVFMAGYFSMQSSSANAAEFAEAVRLVIPHLVAALAAVVFNAIALFSRRAWTSLVAALLYVAAMILMPVYFFGVIAEAILCLGGFFQLLGSRR